MMRTLRLLVVCAAILAAPARGLAAERYALVVSGAAGNADYQRQYDGWRTSFTAVLKARFGFADDHVIVLADTTADGIRKPTRENVRAAFTTLKQRASKDDLVVILLIGHGTVSDVSEGAKFNLVGPDLSAKDWAELVRSISARVVFVNGASGSAPFLQALSARGRVVITATDVAAQQYETIFPEFFVKAFTEDSADADKNGRVSIWEAFVYASAGVREWYQDRGRLQTERPLLDDNGDGVGREAQSPGSDGPLAQATFLDADVPAGDAASPERSALLQRRAAAQSQIDQLRARRAGMPEDQYNAELERLLLELARIDAQLRAR